MILQDTFTVKGNAFNLKPVFVSHASKTGAKNKPSACSKDLFENHMTIHFKKDWLEAYQKDTSVNRIGERLGFAYGSAYWTPCRIAEWLPNEEVMKECREFYEL